MAQLSTWWKKRTPNERTAICVLAGVLLVVGFYRLIYVPQTSAKAQYARQTKKFNKEIAELEASLAEIAEESKHLETYSQESSLVEKEASRLEGNMLSLGQIGQVLSKLSAAGAGLDMHFETIKQDLRANSTNDTDSPFFDIYINVTCTATYNALVNYIKRVEAISPLLRVAKLEVAEPKEPKGPLGSVTLTLTAPIKRSQEAGKMPQTGQNPESISITRSFFASEKPAVAPVSLDKIAVTGITWRETGSTAIVNNEVLRVGDTVEDMVITRIEQDRVVLSDGETSHEVMLK